MNFIKKAAIAAVPTLLLAFSSAAFADHDGTELTQDEKATVSLIHDFQDCMQAEIDNNQEQINQVAAELLNQGVPPQVVEQLLLQMFVPAAEEACIDSMDIDVAETQAKVDAILQEHGPAVFNR